jgi:hypothetical protein
VLGREKKAKALLVALTKRAVNLSVLKAIT